MERKPVPPPRRAARHAVRAMLPTLALTLAATAPPARAQDKLSMAAMLDKDSDPIGRLLYQIYAEAFRRLGLGPACTPAPQARPWRRAWPPRCAR